MNVPCSPSSKGDRWIEAKFAGQPPLYSIILHIAAESSTEQPAVTRYLIGDMPAGLLPFGIDHAESLEAAMDEADTKFGIRKEDWTELSSPPIFAATFDAAIDEAIERASEALDLSNSGEDPIDSDRWQ